MPFDPRSTSYRGIKLDFSEAPAPQAVTLEGFCDFVGTATLADVVLDYPLEAPLVRQLRPAEEVLSERAIASLIGKPVVNSHPRDAAGRRVFVTPQNASQFVCGTVLRAWREESKLKVLLRIYTQQLIDDIRAGKTDLSPGYDCDTIAGAGQTPEGVVFDATQRDHLYNHVAVEGRGRNPGARFDGKDIGMEEIKALIESGKISPEDAKVLITMLQVTAGAPVEPPVEDAATATDPAIAELVKRMDAIEARIAAMKPTKADGVDPATLAKLGTQVAADAAKKFRTIVSARDLARPILGAVKADAIDDPAALHRDIVIAVFPDQKGAVEADFAAGRIEVLAARADMARSTFNRQRTTDAADQLDGNRSQIPKTSAEQEKALAEALKKPGSPTPST